MHIRRTEMSWTGPNDPTPDTAMASGSDAGEPGGHLGPGDLDPDEERLLAALERDSLGGPVDEAEAEDEPEPATDSVAAVRAAEDEAPLPAPGGTPDDGLNPLFRSPGES
jgi:hypothetical protein